MGTNAGRSHYLPVMQVLGRLSLTVGFLALQLASLAGGPGCTIPMGESAATGSGASEMRGMAMAPLAEPDAPDAARHDAPAPVQACATLAPCVYASAAAFVESPVTLLLLPRRTIVGGRETAPAQVVAAPDTPPPRA